MGGDVVTASRHDRSLAFFVLISPLPFFLFFYFFPSFLAFPFGFGVLLIAGFFFFFNIYIYIYFKVVMGFENSWAGLAGIEMVEVRGAQAKNQGGA